MSEGRPLPTEDELAAIREGVRAVVSKFETAFNDVIGVADVPRKSIQFTRRRSGVRLRDDLQAAFLNKDVREPPLNLVG